MVLHLFKGCYTLLQIVAPSRVLHPKGEKPMTVIDIEEVKGKCPKLLSFLKEHQPEHYYNYLVKCEMLEPVYSSTQQLASAIAINEKLAETNLM